MQSFIRTMKKSFVLLCSTLLILTITACQNKPQKSKKAKLVVLISIDQMKSEYLTRFNPQLEAGFKYLLDSAHVFSNAYHNHATTTTAAGHATLATGYFPSNNGIIDNTVYNRKLGYKHYSIEDTSVQFVGIEDCQLNKVSAKYLLKNTLGDYIKKADEFSKTYSVALKDRASILMGGKNANRAFWFDAVSTQMVSTDQYTEDFPEWVKTFTGAVKMEKEIEQGWILESSFTTLPSVSSDSFERENGRFLPWFPHTIASFDTLKVSANKPGTFLWNTPYGDAFVLEFAHQLIISEQLGKGKHTDVLTIGLSAADIIGHHFGPNSYEVLDYYNKIDIYLAQFIEKLDDTVGKDNYILVLTSDHGVAAMPEYLAAQGIDARRIGAEQFKTDLAAIEKTLKSQFSLDQNIILKADYGGVEPNFEALGGAYLNTEDVIYELTNQLEKLDYIENAYSFLDIKDSSCSKEFIALMRNSHRDEFGYFIKLVPKENYLIDMGSNGTTHGSPYSYDRHVPLLIKQPNVIGKKITQNVQTVDIVPTILQMLGISTEENFDGNSLSPLL